MSEVQDSGCGAIGGGREVSDITQRDVRRIQEQEDFAQRTAKTLEELRLRSGVGEMTRQRAKEAEDAWIDAARKAGALKGRIEADEEVRL
jgi:hypothetical protein